ncbi:Gypsy retrotransposon integrase-like protein 1 [Friedmanniomyces endolithicus]|nr:Gypsy retrotransposon integrase-like protein 1 [Friedmanniomyces endolithicus]
MSGMEELRGRPRSDSAWRGHVRIVNAEKLACSYNDGGRMTSIEYIQSWERKVGELECLLGRSSAPSRSHSASQSQSKSIAPKENKPSALDVEEDSRDDVIDTIIEVDRESMNGTPTNDRRPSQMSLHPSDFGGLSLLRRVHKLCKHVSGIQLDSSRSLSDDDLSSAFEVAPPEMDSSISWEAFALLPQRETVDQCIEIVLYEACCNMQFLDREQLRATADEVFEHAEAEETAHLRKLSALIYAVVGLSRLLHPLEPRTPGNEHNKQLNGWVVTHIAR